MEMTSSVVIKELGGGGGCKNICGRLGIIVKWSRRSTAYLIGVKYCSRCEHYMRYDKRHCPCCGCTLRFGRRRKGNNPHRCPLDVRQKIRATKIGRKISEETKQKIRSARKGWKWSAEQRLKLSQAMKGRKTRLGTKTTEQARQNISKGQRGKHFSEETRRKMSQAHIDRRRRKLEQNAITN